MNKQREFVFARARGVGYENGEPYYSYGSYEVGACKEKTIQRVRDMKLKPLYLVRLKYKRRPTFPGMVLNMARLP